MRSPCLLTLSSPIANSSPPSHLHRYIGHRIAHRNTRFGSGDCVAPQAIAIPEQEFTDMNHPIIIGGRIRRLVIDRPSDAEILADATLANANGITIIGQGPFKAIAGVKVAVIVGPAGCTCCLARSGVWCLHRSLYAVATGQVAPPKPAPIPLRPSRERRGWTRRPLWIVRPVTPIRPRTVA